MQDVQSAIATALASLLHLRAVTNFSSEWEKELREIMHCAEVMCLLPDGVLRSVAEQALSLFGMSDELCCALAATTAEGRLLFLRGLLVVLPEETILAPGVTLAASSERSDVEAQIGRGTVVWESDCLFFSPCIFALTTHCSQSNASLCLTSCQLIETWMSRAAMLSRTDAIIGPRLVCNVINIAGVLIDTWNHSSKQVTSNAFQLVFSFLI